MVLASAVGLKELVQAVEEALGGDDAGPSDVHDHDLLATIDPLTNVDAFAVVDAHAGVDGHLLHEQLAAGDLAEEPVKDHADELVDPGLLCVGGAQLSEQAHGVGEGEDIHLRAILMIEPVSGARQILVLTIVTHRAASLCWTSDQKKRAPI